MDKGRNYGVREHMLDLILRWKKEREESRKKKKKLTSRSHILRLIIDDLLQ